jgi:hypothetical protein
MLFVIITVNPLLAIGADDHYECENDPCKEWDSSLGCISINDCKLELMNLYWGSHCGSVCCKPFIQNPRVIGPNEDCDTGSAYYKVTDWYIVVKYDFITYYGFVSECKFPCTLDGEKKTQCNPRFYQYDQSKYDFIACTDEETIV